MFRDLQKTWINFKMASTRDKNGRKSKWDTPASATEAAREAARKLNAMLAAKGKLNTNATPPLQPPAPRSTAVTNNKSCSSSEIFTEEVEINDSPRRLLLCKGTVQSEINKYSGALISIKGQYIPAGEKGNFPGQKPLHLFIQSPSKDNLNWAIKRIHQILQGDDPFSSPPIPPSLAMSQSSTLPSGMHYVQEKVFVGLDNVPPEFNLKEKIVGPGESYFQHVTKETGAKIQLRGRGSGFIEPTSGREAFETLYVYISHNSYSGLGAAKKLVENLIQTVTNAYQAFQMQRSSNTHYSGYGGQGNTRPQHFPRMYMPPVPRYGIPPHRGNAPSYPSYPHPTNQYPPRYNQPQQPPPNHHANSGGQPPSMLYPPMPEGSRHRMNEPRLQHGSPHPMPRMHQMPARDPMYAPEIQSPLQQEPGQLNNDKRGHPLPASERPSETRENQSKTEEGKPDPPRRRFTEAPAKKPTPALDSNPRSADKQRSVSSLGQPSTSSSTLSDSSEVVRKGAMLAPVLPAPRVSNTKTVDATGVFKAPLLPPSSSISVSKRNPPSSSTNLGQKRKLDESEKKSTGIALLGSYDDSSDEEDEETAKRLRNNQS